MERWKQEGLKVRVLSVSLFSFPVTVSVLVPRFLLLLGRGCHTRIFLSSLVPSVLLLFSLARS